MSASEIPDCMPNDIPGAISTWSPQRGKHLDALENEIEAVIERFAAEFDMGGSEVIGSLEQVKFRVLMRTHRKHEESDEDDDGAPA